MIAEIINPSDPYTIEHDDWTVACVATCLLGEGFYSLREQGGTRAMPLFLGDGTFEPWWQTQATGLSLDEYITANRARIADALASVLIGSAADRARMTRIFAAIQSPEDRERAKAAWLDERRSSLNNIGRRAQQLAARLREVRP